VGSNIGDAGFRVSNLGFGVLGVRSLLSIRFGIEGSRFEFRVQVQGSGFRVQGSGFRVQGPG